MKRFGIGIESSIFNVDSEADGDLQFFCIFVLKRNVDVNVFIKWSVNVKNLGTLVYTLDVTLPKTASDLFQSLLLFCSANLFRLTVPHRVNALEFFRLREMWEGAGDFHGMREGIGRAGRKDITT